MAKINTIEQLTNSSIAKKVGGAVGSLMKQAVDQFDVTEAVKQLGSMTDAYTHIQTKLKAINDGQQTLQQLNDKIFASANRTRSSYAGMADTVGKLGTTAGQAFSGNDEMIAFSELMTKSFKLSGTSPQDQSGAMDTIVQAMGKGSLDGKGFDTILANAPILAQGIAQEMDLPIQKLKELSAQGGITADVIKNALFHSAGEINEQFSNMPASFAESVDVMKNNFMQKMAPTFQKISDWLNSSQGAQIIDTITDGLRSMAEVLGNIIGFVLTNWPTIEGIIVFAAAAVGALALASQLAAVMEGIKMAAAARTTIVLFAQALATQGLSAAWRTLNSAMKANVIILVISLLAGLIAWVIHLWNTNDAFAANLMRIWNKVLGFFDQIPIFFAKVGLAVVSKFLDMEVSALQVMESFVNGILERINWLIDKLNKIKGVSIEAIQEVDFTSNTKLAAEAMKQAGEDTIARMEADAVLKAQQREQNVQNMLSQREAERNKKTPGGYEYEYPNIPPEVNQAEADSLHNTETNTYGMKDSMDMSNEDLQYLRDLAEQDVINRFTTAEVKVDMTNHNSINSDLDLDAVVNHLENTVNDKMMVMAEGAY